MDEFLLTNSVINISNGIIEDINSSNNTTFVTVSYTEWINGTRTSQTIRLVVGNNTLILNQNNNTIPVTSLRIGMTVNAAFSSAMTRSIPPQSSAYMIRVVRGTLPDNITIGRIIDINRQNRNFTIISEGNRTSVIRFNVPIDTRILDRFGRPMNFSGLTPGLRVRVRHASFMTASIPPQTTAFEIRVV